MRMRCPPRESRKERSAIPRRIEARVPACRDGVYRPAGTAGLGWPRGCGFPCPEVPAGRRLGRFAGALPGPPDALAWLAARNRHASPGEWTWRREGPKDDRVQALEAIFGNRGAETRRR